MAKEYFFGNKGSLNCPDGETITEVATCKHACGQLNVPMVNLQDDNLCYKDYTGQCYQDGHNGAGASLVCKRGNFVTKVFVSFFKFNSIPHTLY